MQVLKFQSSPSLLPNPQAQRTQLRRRVRHAGPAPLKNAYESGTSDNPQNVSDPKVLPNPSFTPEQTVRVQLDALQQNDEPWTNHGVQTMYEFADEAGSMERSRYFVVLQKDLYHFDHFMGGFSTRLSPLVCNTAYTVLDPKDGREVAPGILEVNAAVNDAKGEDAGVFSFHLKKREIGVKKNSWMTLSLCRQSDREKMMSNRK